MKRAARAKLFLGLIIMTLLSLSIAYLVNNPGLKRPSLAPKSEVKTNQAEIIIDGFRFYRAEEGKAGWELTARKASMKKDTGKANLEDLEAVFNEKDGTVVKLKADQGTFDSAAKTAQVVKKENDVKITTSNGYTLTANDLNWDGQKKELKTDEKVSISGNNIKIEGRGLKARTDLQEVRITDGVKTVFAPR